MTSTADEDEDKDEDAVKVAKDGLPSCTDEDDDGSYKLVVAAWVIERVSASEEEEDK